MRNKTITRREAISLAASAGITSTVMQRSLADKVEGGTTVTHEMIQQAAWVAGIELSEEETSTTLGNLQRSLRAIESNRGQEIMHEVTPAVHFFADPHGASLPDVARNNFDHLREAKIDRPDSAEAIAFLPIYKLASLLKTRQISSRELTQLYLDRLHRYDSLLKFVVTFTDDLALQQADRADAEIKAGNYRGPMHGIPWGAKDLIAYSGYPTTWGATPFKEQTLDSKATVARRLDEAGAVLVAKLSMGALAMGDKWFGKMTRNPWNPQQGSSGSSAGSGSAVAAGAVGFAIGTETLGSIISPSRRCGVTGLRPTFGRVSRHGCMTLAWTMDKLGPMCRSVEDTAIVLDAIHGKDGRDPTVVNRSFVWPPKRELNSVRVGFVERDWEQNDEVLELLRGLNVQLVPIDPPDETEARPATILLDVEAATVFDELTRKKITADLNSWPNIFRAAEFISGVEYLRAMRIRSKLMEKMRVALEPVDLYVAKNDLALTNLTGHPSISMPFGFQERDGVSVPRSVTFTGKLFGETDLLQVAAGFQNATDFHLKRPPLDDFLAAATELE